MITLNIYNLLRECKVERDVEQKYKQILSSYFPKATIGSPYYTDGLLENDDLKLLMEFKYDFDLTKRLQLVDLLIQMLYYLKQFELHGEELPSVLLGGDVNECFCLHSNDLLSYLNEDIDWSIAPSAAASNNPQLAKKLYDDQKIIPFIFNINNDHFNFQFVIDKINQLNIGVVQKIHITELNINRFFSYFRDRIIKQTNKYTPEELVAIFLNCLIDPGNNYPHPRKKNALVTNIAGDISINRSLYDAFFEHFESAYSVEEKKRLTAICDRLIADEARRFHGEFYTPTEWVLEAHKMIEDTFGPNWKEEYVVWDPAWGTGNLTRDFKFKELYCSTLNYGDLQVAQHYNPEAVKFQYDFLNDDVTPDGVLTIDHIKKIPDGLVQALKKNKPIIIFMNPPFGSAQNYDSSSKEKIGETSLSLLMKKSKLNFGDAQKQLYSQFLYKITNLNSNNINICLFSPPLFLTGEFFKYFRDYFMNIFCYKNGFLMNSIEFDGLSSWGICFSIWKKELCTNKETFLFKVKDRKDFKIQTIGKKIIYNLDNKLKASSWVRQDLKGLKTYDYPQMSSAIGIKQKGNGKIAKNNIGVFLTNANNVYCNTTNTSILSSAFTGWSGISIIPENFLKCSSLFTARKTITPNWVNQKDEYLAPNEQHPEYPQWNTDAIIYSLFNGSSNQSSLRQITYKDKLWDIKNEWFWLSNEQMLQLANENGFDELYHDAQGDNDRFVSNKIQESSFSEDAAEVYNKACELVVKTFPYREQLHEEHPEWHLHTWDAGWYQIKLILKKYFKDDLKEFNVLYKAFEDRMREGVYKFGFLK
jgi:hypothetical protein